MKIAERMDRLGTETAFEVLVKARALEAQGRDIVHLEIGEPDFATADHIIEAGIRALRDGMTKYTPSAGIPELREEIARHVSATRRVSVSPDQVVVTPGAKPILFFAMLALIEPGDEVLYPAPGFPIYESMIHYLGAKAVPYRLREENQFRFDPDEFRALANARTRMIVLNSPHNPTGGVLEKADLEVVAQVANQYDCAVFTDEIYWRVLYDGTFSSPYSIPGMAERTILLDGFSKTYSMTGWRLGWGVMPAELAGHVTRLQTNSNSCVAGFTQYAGLEALRGPQEPVDRMVAAFKERRDAIVDGLNAVPGFKCARPRGAFYAYPNVQGTGWDSRKLADYVLNEAGVACLSGTAFGAAGEGYLRFSYANSLENIRRALVRLREAVSKIQD
ncbi:MAG: pyridoxal phosphate-dependent aminotransferase [Chloroflexi bacterium]|nr:pyridoxal phosphate-dependent aminotransferase [Chloroflexota bacterium]